MFLIIVRWSFPFFIINLNYGDRIPPRYMIDLDLAPENRWDKIIDDHKELIPAVIDEVNHYVPKFLQPIAWWIDENILLRTLPEQYVREMRGIATRSGLRIGEVIGMNIFILANVGCTSIVAEDRKGRIIHGRNLDYEMSSVLRNLTIIADFTRNGNIIYTAVTFVLQVGLCTGQRPGAFSISLNERLTFVLQVGLCTGQRPGAFSISLNERFSGSYIDTILMELYTRFKRPVTLTIRMVLEEKETFDEAKEILMKEHFVAPSYLIIAGTKIGQACIITRNRWNATDLKCTNAQKGQWFLVETNFDPWKIVKDKRRQIAEKVLQKIGRNSLNCKKVLEVLATHPVKNNLTIFSTVMSPIGQCSLYDSTIIRE
uniref:N-acylethanolamine-hydrolyzing acid amidase n=1 Tax=Setaria digitata TaxID=48799 RepID=A0A915PUX7_9BILA